MTSSTPSVSVASLRLASRDPVIQALSGFANKPVADWLPNGHPGVGGQLLNQQGKPYSNFAIFKTKFSPQQALDVLAATCPSHCLDGWTFFSRALAALLSGDSHTTRHLAYYAQLRAALSLLHCHGIGIFNGVNFAVDTSGKLHHIDVNAANRKGLGTHTAAWVALRCWAEQPSSAKVFLESVKFRGISLLECIDAVWPSAAPAPLLDKVIETWGVDLKRSAEEHESRNISSYCAHAFNVTHSDLAARLSLIESVWRGLEPDGRGGFPVLDRHLLRKLLEFMKVEQSKIAPQGKLWDVAFPRLDPSIRGFITQHFIERTEEPDDHLVLAHAASKQPGDAHAMVSRALLLLRCATAAVRSAFADARFDLLADDLQPWFDTVGIDRGFWSNGDPPEHFEDLWDLVSYAVADLGDHVATDLSDQLGVVSVLGEQSILLSQAERACIWGVGA